MIAPSQIQITNGLTLKRIAAGMLDSAQQDFRVGCTAKHQNRHRLGGHRLQPRAEHVGADAAGVSSLGCVLGEEAVRAC